MLLPLLISSACALPIVVIDPGHGGTQHGAAGVCGVLEKDVTLQISNELSNLLRASEKIEVVQTRTDDRDLSLEERATIANLRQADMLISIHANASPNSKHHGIETFFLSERASTQHIKSLVERENEGARNVPDNAHTPLGSLLQSLTLRASHRESQSLAIRLQEDLTEKVGVSARGVLQAPLLVLAKANMASTLVEVGFLTNPEECAKIRNRTYQQRLAQSIATTVFSHLRDREAVLAQNDLN